MDRTPLYSALKKRAESGLLRLHMPGHKGKGLINEDLFRIDFTELPGTGNLYEGIPPISDSEALMAEAAGAAGCCFLTGGSTQGLMAALGAACRPGSKLLLDRGSHRAVYNAMAHLDLRPIYLYPRILDPFDIAGEFDLADVEAALDEHPDLAAMIITSPTYYGVMRDIPSIAKLCKKRGVILIVDEAHGAHLPFLDGYASAIALGADLSVASAHKTLPALGMGALLYTSGRVSLDRLRYFASMFGTSSPSYPIMASMDLARAYMENDGRKSYEETARRVKMIREDIKYPLLPLTEKKGLKLDPARLTVCTGRAGLSGYEAAEVLERECGVAVEMADLENIVAIFTCADSSEDFLRFEDALTRLAQKAKPVNEEKRPIPCPPPKPCMTPRQAAYGPQMRLPLAEAAGQIAAIQIAPYPPGIPVIAPGERITEKHLAYLEKKSYNIGKDVAIVAL